LDWSRETLAKASHVGLRTLVDFERGAREPHYATLEALRRALETAGVQFRDDAAGVALGAGRRAARPTDEVVDLVRRLERPADIAAVKMFTEAMLSRR
jgi:transcriptional regulator with XRE-family HTH domain